MIRITATNAWKSEFIYDGLGQRRVRVEYIWQSGAWQTNSVSRYVYVGGLVVQERNGNNVPLVSYTRTSGAGGGIGGMLARTDCATQTHCYYHGDGCGNVTLLVNVSQVVVARYLYDPYGNTISASGPMAESNTYGYASKELHVASGLIYFGARFYNPSLQRWMNADPIQEGGGINLFGYVGNSPLGSIDAWGHGPQKAERDDIGGNGYSIDPYWWSRGPGWKGIDAVQVDDFGNYSGISEGMHSLWLDQASAVTGIPRGTLAGEQPSRQPSETRTPVSQSAWMGLAEILPILNS